MTPIEALQHDPKAQLAEKHRQKMPWLDHEQLRPGDHIAIEEWAATGYSGNEPGLLKPQYEWYTSYTGLLVSWRRTPSNDGSEFEILTSDGLDVFRVYDCDAHEVRTCLVQRRQLS